MAKGFFPPFAGTQSEPNNNFDNPTASSSDMSAIPSSFSLPLQQMAIPIYTATPPSREDVEIGGRVLFQNFIHEELANEGLPEDAIEVDNPPPDVFGDAGPDEYAANYVEHAPLPALASIPQGYNNPQFVTFGANLRTIADQFGRSHERQQVREQADQVDLGSINYESFSSLLSELFKDGLDKYCFVALFYFCSDVLIRCIKKELHTLGSKLFFWALDFLIKKVCKWVYDHGGWERVLSTFSDYAWKLLPIGALGAIGVIIVCGIIYIRNNS